MFELIMWLYGVDTAQAAARAPLAWFVALYGVAVVALYILFFIKEDKKWGK